MVTVLGSEAPTVLVDNSASTTIYVNLSQTALAYIVQDMGKMAAELNGALNYERYELRESVIDAVLVTLFSGLFTVLAAVAAYILIWKDITRRPHALMLAGVLLMWLSALLFWASTLVKARSLYAGLERYTAQAADTLADAVQCFWSARVPEMSDCAESGASFVGPGYVQGARGFPTDVAGTAYVLQDCVGTAALTVNVVIGDLIVWWRAWVLWPGSRVVRGVCVLTVVLTLVTGIVDTTDACRPSAFTVASEDTAGAMFSGDAWGVGAVFLSLFTNLAATALIGYRAWEHRRVIMSYLKGTSARTQVERTLALLIESGLLYCVLWVVIAAYALTESKAQLFEVSSGFTYGFSFVVKGCLVPLIGMYPTLIIIVCAVDKSLNERTAEDALQTMDVNMSPSGDLNRVQDTSIVFHAYRSAHEEVLGLESEVCSVATSSGTPREATSPSRIPGRGGGTCDLYHHSMALDNRNRGGLEAGQPTRMGDSEKDAVAVAVEDSSRSGSESTLNASECCHAV